MYIIYIYELYITYIIYIFIYINYILYIPKFSHRGTTMGSIIWSSEKLLFGPSCVGFFLDFYLTQSFLI